MEQIDGWYDAGEYDEIIAAVCAVPERYWTEELVEALATAYNNTGCYDTALKVLMRHPEEENFFWHYMVGYALYYKAVDNADRMEDSEVRRYLGLAHQAFSCALEKGVEDPDIEDDCRDFLSMIEEIHGPVVYSDSYSQSEAEAVERYICSRFGEYSSILDEGMEEACVNILVIPPHNGHNFYTLSTIGLGACRMNIPDDDKGGFAAAERAELIIKLPFYWSINNEDERWFWPVQLLIDIAHSVMTDEDVWLGEGQVIASDVPYAGNTRFSGAILTVPEEVQNAPLTLPGGSRVDFYQPVPLYPEEIELLKADVGAEDLLMSMIKECGTVVDIKRINCALIKPDIEWTELSLYLDNVMDDAIWHLNSIKQKELPLDELTAYNHMAVFLRWCIEHDLMSDAFCEKNASFISSVKSGKNKRDLRKFIRDDKDFKGCLSIDVFNEIGAAFCRYYYLNSEFDDDLLPSYPADVDTYALHYFGVKKYHCRKFKDEAYLFIPYDEVYYKGMSKYIAERYQQWKKFAEAIDNEPDEDYISPILFN